MAINNPNFIFPVSDPQNNKMCTELNFIMGVLPYVGYIGMCCCEGYGFQAVYFSIGYINQSIWV